MGEILLYLDADTIIPPGYLAQLVALFDGSAVLAASTAFRFHDGTWLMNGVIAVNFAIYHGLHVLKLARFIFGGSFAVRQAAMQRIGGFNLALVFYGEDTDLSKRLARQGEIAFLRHPRSLTSARRYVRQGVARTCLLYFLNYLSMLVFNRTVTLPRRALLPRLRISLFTLLFSLFTLCGLGASHAEVYARAHPRFVVPLTQAVPPRPPPCPAPVHPPSRLAGACATCALTAIVPRTMKWQRPLVGRASKLSYYARFRRVGTGGRPARAGR